MLPLLCVFNCPVGFIQHDADEIFHSILNLTQKQMTDEDLVGFICVKAQITVHTIL